ncbi:MAG: TetR/AcrR family transcriptional regulator [Lachnospiraceae bacterium]|nr:TetR/AcrR family transcriptional regulator [Lachnospiraceae bacterium]
MDRRQRKTRKAIFDAFTKLLEDRSYSNITVQEIIDEADISRSTFYSHFETKDELLRELCTEIFEHVFSDHISKEKSHDFSGSDNDLKEEITYRVCQIL